MIGPTFVTRTIPTTAVLEVGIRQTKELVVAGLGAGVGPAATACGNAQTAAIAPPRRHAAVRPIQAPATVRAAATLPRSQRRRRARPADQTCSGTQRPGSACARAGMCPTRAAATSASFRRRPPARPATVRFRVSASSTPRQAPARPTACPIRSGASPPASVHRAKAPRRTTPVLAGHRHRHHRSHRRNHYHP